MPRPTPDEPLAKWLRLERLTLDVQLERDLGDVAAACWEILGEAPARGGRGHWREADDDGSPPLWRSGCRQRAVRRRLPRAGSVAGHVPRRAARPAPELRRPLVKFLDAGIAHGGDAPTPGALLKYHAARRARPARRTGARPAPVDRRRRTGVAVAGLAGPAARRARPARRRDQRLRGDPAADELAAAATCGAGPVVSGRRSPRRLRAGDRRRLHGDGRELAAADDRRPAGHVVARTTSTLPTELDEHVLLVFQALFRKSTSPGRLRVAVARLLPGVPRLPAAADGSRRGDRPHAAAGVSVSGVAQLATCSARCATRRSPTRCSAASPSCARGELTPLDARALDLLEAMIERRSSEVLNQPGPHAEAAVAALRAGVPRRVGRRRSGADGAAAWRNLGTITAPALAEQQVRQLRELHAQGAAGQPRATAESPSGSRTRCSGRTTGRTRLSACWTAPCGSSTGRPRARWPADATEPLDVYVNLLERRSRYAEAETLLKRLARKPATPDMANWFAERLDRVYLAALDGDGQVSLGRGEELYRNLVDHIDRRARHGRPRAIAITRVMRLLDVFTHANNKPSLGRRGQAGSAQFAFERLPGVLRRQTSNYELDRRAHGRPAARRLIGPRDGLEFLIEQHGVVSAVAGNVVEQRVAAAWLPAGRVAAADRRQPGRS